MGTMCSLEKMSKELELANNEYATRSLGIFSMKNPLRKLLVLVVTHQLFNFIVMVVILINCVLLALLNPVALVYPGINSPLNEIIDKTEIYFQGVFTVELVFKVIAFGFWTEKNYKRGTVYRAHTYLHDSWNIIDFLVVVIGYVGIILTAVDSSLKFNLSVIRALRTLRPLRLLRQIPGLQVVIDAFIYSMIELESVFALTFVLLGTLSLLGVSLFKGTLHHQCLLPDGTIYPQDNSNGRYCSMSPTFGRQCPEGTNTTCGFVAYNPNLNVTSFDNFGYAALAIFQDCTISGWTQMMYMYGDVMPGFSEVYFIIVIIVGNFFLFSVISAVVAVNYTVQSGLAESRRKMVRDGNLIKAEMDIKEAEAKVSKRAAVDFPLSHRASVEMRLMYSWEKCHTKPGYKSVTERQYLAYSSKHGDIYPRWLAVMAPIIDAIPSQTKNAPNDNTISSASKAAPAIQLSIVEDLAPISGASSGGAVVSRSQSIGKKEKEKEKEKQNAESSGLSVFAAEVLGEPKALDPTKALQELKAEQEEAQVEELEKAEAEAQADAAPDLKAAENVLHKIEAEEEEIATKILGLCFNLDGVDEGARPGAHRIRKIALRISKSTIFERLIIFVIVLNTIVLAATFFPETVEIANILDIINYVLTGIFTLEMLIKLTGLGIINYFRDRWDWLDFVIVVVSLIEFGFPSGLGDSSIATVFRALRLLRILRLLKDWKSLRHMLFAMVHTLEGAMPLVLLFFIMLYIFAAAGLSLFGGQFLADPPNWDCTPSYVYYYLDYCPPRSNFDNFLWAYVTSFQLITGENWNGVMYDGISAVGWGVVVYFILVVFFGQLVVLNLFLGCCIDGFMSAAGLMEEADKVEAEVKAKEAAAEAAAALLEEKNKAQDKDLRISVAGQEGNGKEEGNAAFQADGLEVVVQRTKEMLKVVRKFEDHPSYYYKSLHCLSNRNILRRLCARLVLSQIFDYFILAVIFFSCILLALETPQLPAEELVLIGQLNIAILAVFAFEALTKIIAFGFAGHLGAYFSDGWNRLDFFLVIIGFISVFFEQFAVAKSIRALRALRPLRVLRHYEALRVMLQSLSYALVPVAHVSSVCVFVYFVFSILFVQLYGGKVRSCYNTSDGSRNFTEGSCFPYEGYNPPDFCTLDDPYRCYVNDTYWQNPTYMGSGTTYHFDNVGNAFLTLFEASSFSLWLEVMKRMVDHTEVGHNMVRGSNDGHAFLLIFFLIIMRFFLLQLLVAVVVESFLRTQEETDGGAFLSESQKEWVKMNQEAYTTGVIWKPKRLNKNSIFYPIRRVARLIARSETFDSFILVVIVANTAVLASDHYDPSPEFVLFFTIADYTFGSIYIFEMLVKMIAYGPGFRGKTGYFTQGRNYFDFFIVVAVIVGWGVNSNSDAEAEAFFQAIVSLRALRALRLLTYSKGIRELTYTSLGTIPALLNFLLLLFLVIFIFAVSGVSLFSEMTANPNIQYSFIYDWANFNDFGSAMLILIRMATGESWDGLMHDMASYSLVAYPYCVVYTLLVQYIMTNLFVAIILVDMQEFLERNAKERSDPKAKTHEIEFSTSDYVEMFSDSWAEVRLYYDRELRDKREKELPSVKLDNKNLPVSEAAKGVVKAHDGRGFLQKFWTKNLNQIAGEVDMEDPSLALPVRYFPKLIERVKQPLGICGVITGTSPANLMRLYKRLKVPVTQDGFIFYHPTLQSLIDSHVLSKTIQKWIEDDVLNKEPEIDHSALLAMDEFLRLRIPGVHGHEVLFTEKHTLVEMIAAEVLRRAFRRWKALEDSKKRDNRASINDEMNNSFGM